MHQNLTGTNDGGQRMIAGLDPENTDECLPQNLHNPGPVIPPFFYILPETLAGAIIGLRTSSLNWPIEDPADQNPQIPMATKPKWTVRVTSLWRQISFTWVSMNGNRTQLSLCLGRSWNAPSSTTTGNERSEASLPAPFKSIFAERPALP